MRKQAFAGGCLAVGLMVVVGACGGSATAQSRDAIGTATDARTSGATHSPETTSAGDSPTGSASDPTETTPGRAAFLAPSGNINCEINDVSEVPGNAAFCETMTPPESASLTDNGSVTICGIGCEGNAGVNTPTLAYGGRTEVGPYQCLSATAGLTCTVSGKGFEISRAGISPVGAPLVTLAPGSYSGSVTAVSSNASQMTFTIASTGCSGLPSPGAWTVDLTGATFVTNSEPVSGQGQAVTISRSQWEQQIQNRRTWTVVVSQGEPLEVTDGPTC